jgi:hypothetical protein
MKRYALLVAAVALAAGLSGVAAADSGPLADAGLDQEVESGTTVQLDATGSSHPDGSIEEYEWSIETPDGRQIWPACRDCARTEFTPTDPGRYDVTVTVTDANDRADSDTLFVYVNEAGPTVALDGETEPTTGSETPYVATAETTNADLETLIWRVDNRTLAEDSLNGTADRSNRSLTFTESGTRRLEVVVRDSQNRTDSAVLLVDPQEPSRSPDDTDDSDWSPDDSPDEPSAQGADNSVEQPDEKEPTDCINGVFIDDDAGCIGHISDASHTDQEEGCEEDFCGAENPAGEVGYGGDGTGRGSGSDRISPSLDRDSSNSSNEMKKERSANENHHASGGENGSAGYIGI